MNFDDDGEGGMASPVVFGFNMGTSGVAGEMIRSIYRILTALQEGHVSTAMIMKSNGADLRAP